MLHGSHGTAHHIKIRKFGTLEEAKAWFQERNITLCGVEIVPQAVDVRTHPFVGDTAIMMGNEVRIVLFNNHQGAGMNERQLAMCDQFVYIPQFGHGTASLNVNVAASIVMEHFSSWAGYEEAPRETDRAKFVVDSFETGKDRERTEEELQLAQERKKKQQEDVDYSLDGNLFVESSFLFCSIYLSSISNERAGGKR